MNRRHLIGRSPAASTAEDGLAVVTITERSPRWTAMLTTVCLAILPGLMITQDWPTLPRDHVLAAAAYLVIVAAVSVWGCCRGWRMGLRLDDHGVTVRNFFRTYQFGWPEVRRFVDGSVNGGNAGHLWALSVVLWDGRAVTARGTASGKRNGRPQTLTAIRQAAGRHAIPAALTGRAMKRESPESPANPGLHPDPGGQPGLRHWDGGEWSPFLRPDPASSRPGEKAPAEMWSPLPGSERQWQDAATQARRAGIIAAAWLAATAAAVTVTVALYARDLSKPHADFTLAVWALIAAASALARTYGAWQHRKNLKKIGQAAQAAAGLASTRGTTSASNGVQARMGSGADVQ